MSISEHKTQGKCQVILESEYLNEPAVIISWFSNEEANVRKREVDDTSQYLVSLSTSPI